MRAVVATIPSPARQVLLEVLAADEARRAAEIARLHSAGLTPATVELLIDVEEDPSLRALLVGMLREAGREG